MLEKKNWYERDIHEVYRELGASAQTGLTSKEAKRRLEEHGPNELQQKKGASLFEMFLAQLKDYMVIILIVASIVSILVGEVTDAIVILGIVVINAVLGVIQEYRAGKALEALKRMSAPNAKVLRDGEPITIPARELVPGDTVPPGLVEAMKAMADPTRLRILRYLAEGPQTPSQLARRLRLRPPTVTHHLNTLRLAGLVEIIIHAEGERGYALHTGGVQRAMNHFHEFIHLSKR